MNSSDQLQAIWDKYDEDMRRIHEDHQRSIKYAMVAYAVIAVAGLIMMLAG